MIRRVFRVVHQRYAADPISGEGARRYGGRWNSPGVAAVYASESLALAVLELLANLQEVVAFDEYRMVELAFSESAIEFVDVSKLPAGWRGPAVISDARTIGDVWLSSRRSLALAVPSAVLASELNFVLNPVHSGFSKVECSRPHRLPIDARLQAVRIMERS